MFRISKRLVRVVTLVVLFQFLAPIFISAFSTRSLPENKLVFSEQHCSAIAPTFLKENKEEKEVDECSTDTHLTPLMDLAIHAINLKDAHRDRYLNFIHHVNPQGPPRLELFCSYLI